jgi:hypothetical protein
LPSNIKNALADPIRRDIPAARMIAPTVSVKLPLPFNR